MGFRSSAAPHSTQFRVTTRRPHAGHKTDCSYRRKQPDWNWTKHLHKLLIYAQELKVISTNQKYNSAKSCWASVSMHWIRRMICQWYYQMNIVGVFSVIKESKKQNLKILLSQNICCRASMWNQFYALILGISFQNVPQFHWQNAIKNNSLNRF